MNLFEEIKKKKKAEAIVEDILEQEPATRKSDNTLSVRYYQLLEPKNTLGSKVDFMTFFESPKKYNGFDYKTLERARRKIQERRPELKDSKVKELRVEQEEAFKEYARGEL